MLAKALLLGLPLLAILATYLVYDPFRVLRHYDRFDAPTPVISNRDYISTQMYLNTYQQRPYTSFILGNSRTVAFRTRDWMPYTHDTLTFHYDAAGESLYGIWKKLQFLEAHGATLRNVLLIGDAELLAQVTDKPSYLSRKDPRTTGEGPLGFQLAFIKAYFSDLFFYQFLKQHATGQFTPAMENMLEQRRVYYDPLTNDMSVPDVDAEIRRDSAGFYARNAKVHNPRKVHVASAVIGGPQLQQLVAIRTILQRHGTHFLFVISPNFNQAQLNPADLELLQRTLGAEHIHDLVA